MTDSKVQEINTTKAKNVEYDYDNLSVDKKILGYYETALTRDSLSNEQVLSLEKRLSSLKSQKCSDGRLSMRFKDIELLHQCLQRSRPEGETDDVYLYQLMLLAQLDLPKPSPEQNSPEYEAKMERLRLLASEAEYQQMTKNVGSQKKTEETIGKDLKQMDSSVTFMFNFVLTVVGAFAFGYKAVEYSIDVPNVSLQLTVGVTLATIVFFADIYFIIKDYV